MSNYAATSTLSKTSWSPGVWRSEPDVVSFTEDRTGYPVLLNRHPLTGAWLAYVGVPAGHPAYGVTTAVTIPCLAAGALSYAGPATGASATSVPWWVGFSASSPDGAQPALNVSGTYTDLPGAREQAVRLAFDLARYAAQTGPIAAPVTTPPASPPASPPAAPPSSPASPASPPAVPPSSPPASPPAAPPSSPPASPPAAPPAAPPVSPATATITLPGLPPIVLPKLF